LKALIIANPLAGKKIIKRHINAIKDTFTKNNYDVDVFFTEASGDARQKASDCANAYELIVCCGGDGTVNEVVSGIMPHENRPPIGYIPAGSTNDFANTLSLSKIPAQAANNIIKGTPHTMDIGSFNGRNFVYIACFGAFTRSSYSTPQDLKNVLGHLAYILEGTKEIPNLKPCHVKVETDGKIYEDDYIFGSVSNTTSVAGLIKLSKDDVSLSDGFFEVILIKNPKTLIDVGKILVSFQTQKYDEEWITFLHTDKATFTFTEDVPWSLDGEFQKAEKTVNVINHRGAVTIIK